LRSVVYHGQEVSAVPALDPGWSQGGLGGGSALTGRTVDSS
jgi:hypothetical protein